MVRASEAEDMSTTWIAEEPVIFVHKDGRRAPGRIAIAAPVALADHCACEVALEGLDQPRRIFGDSTLQALLLGAAFLGMQVQAFLKRGGKVLDDEGNELALRALFGPLLRLDD
jgi:hypothetical protein